MSNQVLSFTPEQKTAYRAAYCPKSATQEQVDLFFTECERRGLIPGTHVVFQLRKGKEYDPQLQRQVDVQKVTLITTINALRLIAERSGKFKGYGQFTWYYCADEAPHAPSVTSNIPLGRIPHAVTVQLFRDGWSQPVFSVARYEACVQLYDNKPTTMWFRRGEEQLAKCAEANGLRMVAPEECGGLYIEEEMPGSENEPAAASEVWREKEPVAIPTATVAPAVNQQPAAVLPAAPAVVRFPVAKAAPPPVPKPALIVPPQRPPAPPATAPVAPPAPPVSNRRPAVQSIEETPEELAEFAARMERDRDKPSLTDDLIITDDDLPENLRPGYIASTVNVPKSEPAADTPSPEQYQQFMGRCAKIVRDKLEKQAGLKNAGPIVKDYLLRKSAQPKLQKISSAMLEQLIVELEKAEPATAAKIVTTKEK